MSALQALKIGNSTAASAPRLKITPKRNVFVTGGSGCVGHYLLEALCADPRNRVHVLVRDPTRIRLDLRSAIDLVIGDLSAPESFLGRLRDMDTAILAAVAWGGDDARQINVWSTWAICNALDPGRCSRVVYLSTASLLDQDGNLHDAPRAHGTGYILQKLEALEGLEKTRVAKAIVPIFPTIVLGGDERHPYSHASCGLLRLMPYVKFFRFFSIEGKFHIIHASDVARVLTHLLDHSPARRPLVLGNAPLSVGEGLQELARIAGFSPCRSINVTRLAKFLPTLFGHYFTSWDRHCLKQRHFTYPVFDIPTTLGTSGYETLTGILTLRGSRTEGEIRCDQLLY